MWFDVAMFVLGVLAGAIVVLAVTGAERGRR